MQAVHHSYDILSDSPPKGIYFQVLVDYVDTQDDDLCSDPLENFCKATNVAKEVAKNIIDNNPGSSLVTLDSDEMDDEYHMYIINKSGDGIAKLGIVAEDYRDVTFH